MAVNLIFLFATIVLTLALTVCFLLWFRRDPDRQPPRKNNIIVSPADGTVIYVERFEAGNLPVPKKFGRKNELGRFGDFKTAFDNGGHIIGIYLSPFNVHVTRAPISGCVLFTGRRAGKLISKKLLEFKTDDEITLCIIQGNGVIVGVVQMAAYIARRALSYLESHQHVNIGERIGKIRLGSQVDLIVSDKTGMRIIVKPGNKVRAGESIIAAFELNSL